MSSESYYVKELFYDITDTVISCNRNRITNIILPSNNNIIELRAKQNYLTMLPMLNNNCTYIDVSSNRISKIEKYPERVAHFNLSRNRIMHIDFTMFSESLTYLNISHNFIKYIPILPSNLRTFIACDNKLQQIPTLPNNLEILKFAIII